MDPYQALGVSEDADQKTIKKAYRKLAAQHHPDRGGDAEKFKEVAEAYSTLSDNRKRQEYHARRQNPMHGFSMEDLFGGRFGDFFRPRPARPRQVKKNTEDLDIQFNLRINLEQVKRGSRQRINFKRKKECVDCNGEGGENKAICNVCGGTGVQTASPTPFFIQQMPCQKCLAQGVTFQRPCKTCNTNGFIDVHDTVVIKIEEERGE